MKLSNIKKKLHNSEHDRELSIAVLLASAGKIGSYGCDINRVIKELEKLEEESPGCVEYTKKLCDQVAKMAGSRN